MMFEPSVGQALGEPVAFRAALAALEDLSAHDPAQVCDRLRAVKQAYDQASPVERVLIRDQTVERLAAAGFRAPAQIVDVALGPAGEFRDGHQGRVVLLRDPDPWPEPVDGAMLLDALEALARRYVAMPPEAATAVALWIAHTYAEAAADHSPILAITSPTRRCGKTRLLDVLTAVVRRPLPVANVTAPALFRAVERYTPTLLIDEVDTLLGQADELRGILNSGHDRATAQVIRTVGDDHEPRQFSTWCPKAMACIGRLPGTLQDRSIEVRLRRRTPAEHVARLRSDHLRREAEPLRRQLARWAADALPRLRAADPAIPDGLHDRAADHWRPLFAIADLAGGAWPDRTRAAALARSGEDGGEDPEAGVELLRDLRQLFEERGAVALPSRALVESLVGLEDRPWATWRHGRPLTARDLARLLAPFGVRSRNIKLSDGSVLKGYAREDFGDPWERYLPDVPRTMRYPATDRIFSGETHDFGSATATPGSGSPTPRIASIFAAGSGVAHAWGGLRQKGEFPS